MELPLTAKFKGRTGETRSNRLLAAMEADSRARIEPHLEPIELKLGAVVCEAGGLLKHAYFPQGVVLSLLTVLENGSAIETANIGREGAFGLFAAMYSRVSFNRCLVQFEGDMIRCPIELLQAKFKHSEHVRDLFVSYKPGPSAGDVFARQGSERRSPVASGLTPGAGSPSHAFEGCPTSTSRAALQY